MGDGIRSKEKLCEEETIWEIMYDRARRGVVADHDMIAVGDHRRLALSGKLERSRTREGERVVQGRVVDLLVGCIAAAIAMICVILTIGGIALNGNDPALDGHMQRARELPSSGTHSDGSLNQRVALAIPIHREVVCRNG